MQRLEPPLPCLGPPCKQFCSRWAARPSRPKDPISKSISSCSCWKQSCFLGGILRVGLEGDTCFCSPTGYLSCIHWMPLEMVDASHLDISWHLTSHLPRHPDSSRIHLCAATSQLGPSRALSRVSRVESSEMGLVYPAPRNLFPDPAGYIPRYPCHPVIPS